MQFVSEGWSSSVPFSPFESGLLRIITVFTSTIINILYRSLLWKHCRLWYVSYPSTARLWCFNVWGSVALVSFRKVVWGGIPAENDVWTFYMQFCAILDVF